MNENKFDQFFTKHRHIFLKQSGINVIADYFELSCLLLHQNPGFAHITVAPITWIYGRFIFNLKWTSPSCSDLKNNF